MILVCRLPSGEMICVEAEESDTVKTLKTVISLEQKEVTDVNAIRLVVRGKILSNDEHTLDLYKITEEDVVHVARNMSKNTAGTNVPIQAAQTAMGASDDEFKKVMDNPIFKSLTSNPEFLDIMFQNDPRLKKIIDENPEVKEQLRHPETLKNIGQMMRNPTLMKEALRNQDRALSNIEAIPGGFSKLSSMFNSMNDPATMWSPDPSTDEANRLMAKRLGVTSANTGDAPNTKALPNVWAAPAAIDNQNQFPMFPNWQSFSKQQSQFPSFQFPPTPQTTQSSKDMGGRINPMLQAMMNSLNNRPPMESSNLKSTNDSEEPVEVRFHEQLATLKEMGFDNEEKNKRALLASGGNTEAAVIYLLQL